MLRVWFLISQGILKLFSFYPDKITAQWKSQLEMALKDNCQKHYTTTYFRQKFDTNGTSITNQSTRRFQWAKKAFVGVRFEFIAIEAIYIKFPARKSHISHLLCVQLFSKTTRCLHFYFFQINNLIYISISSVMMKHIARDFRLELITFKWKKWVIQNRQLYLLNTGTLIKFSTTIV